MSSERARRIAFSLWAELDGFSQWGQNNILQLKKKIFVLFPVP